ncbi:MAG: type II toxin-antitoxin system VapC family toxin [Methanosarcinales archaeon]
MLDTNAVIAYREGILEVCTLIEGAEMLFLPVIVLGELLYGALNSAQPEKNKQDIYKFLEYSVLVPIDEAIAVRYSTIRLSLKRTGNPIPENDLWIAAMAIEFDMPLLTRDTHFDYVQGLKVINWVRK